MSAWLLAAASAHALQLPTCPAVVKAYSGDYRAYVVVGRQRMLRLRGGRHDDGGGDEGAPERLGPFMDDESEERALRRELGVEIGGDESGFHPEHEEAPEGSAVGDAPLVERLLPPEYLHAVVEEIASGAHEGVGAGGEHGVGEVSKTAHAHAETVSENESAAAELLLISLRNGVCVSLKRLPLSDEDDGGSGGSGGGGTGAENARMGGEVAQDEEDVAQSNGSAVGARPEDMVKMRLLLHGGAAVLGVGTRPHTVSAALNTWVGGGAAGHHAAVMRRYLCHHQVLWRWLRACVRE